MTPDSQQRLIALFQAGQTPVHMTGQEGAELVQLGLIQAHQDQPGPVPGSCRVTITEAGMAALTAGGGQTVAPPAAAPTPRAKPVVGEIEQGIAIPVAKRGGGGANLVPRKSEYKFDDLPEPTVDAEGNPICASVHVSCEGGDIEKLAAKISSSVSAANKRSEVEVKDENGQPVMESVEKKTLIKGEDGKALLDANGKRQYNVAIVTQPAMQATKKFLARKVNKDDPKGEGVRIFRVPLNY